MGVFYVVHIGNINLRSIPFLKIHVIALSWSLLLIAFPIVNEGMEKHISIPVFSHYLYILALTIPFDIRDLQYDSKEYKTIPQQFGVQGSKVIAEIALMMFAALVVMNDQELLKSNLFWLAMIVSGTLIILVKKSNSDWYFAGAIDGSIALLGLSYLMN